MSEIEKKRERAPSEERNEIDQPDVHPFMSRNLEERRLPVDTKGWDEGLPICAPPNRAQNPV